MSNDVLTSRDTFDHPVFGTVRLGRPAIRQSAKTIRLASYVKPSLLPKAPAKVDYAKAVTSWPMYGNDSLGDCTIADAAHMIQAWAANAGHPVTPPEAQVIAAYWATGSQDDGRFELDVLNYWRKTGIAGHKIEAFASIDPRNRPMVKTACWLFGGVYIGVALPITAQHQTKWAVVNGAGSDADPGSWGGHAVPIVGYTSTSATIVTWGRTLTATWGVLAGYMDEAYGVVSKDWLDARGKTPSGLDLASMLADVKAL